MKHLNILICAFGLIIGIGGLIGFFTAGSIASLIAGSAFGFLLLTCGYLMQTEHPLGNSGAILLTCILSGFFSYRYAITEKFMPSGMMALMSCAVLTMVCTTLWRKKCEE